MIERLRKALADAEVIIVGAEKRSRVVMLVQLAWLWVGTRRLAVLKF